MRLIRRALLFVAALAFLFEAWLWDRFAALGYWLARVLPFERAKQAIAGIVRRLPPYGALVLFVLPAATILPFKLAGLYLIAHGHVGFGALTFVAAKLVGFGLTAFLFDLTRDTLLQLGWFARLYASVMRARDWAHRLVDPYKARIREAARELKGRVLRDRPGLSRLLLRLRGKIQRARG